jgi:hypothetical protein
MLHRPVSPCLLLALVTTLAACGDGTAPSASSSAATARVHDRVSVTVPFNQVTASMCLREASITITGTFHEEFTSVAVPGDPEPYHYELTDVVRGTGIGSSGTEYKFLDTEHQTLSQPDLESLHYTFSFPTQMLLIGKGGAPNRILHFSTHTTVLPSGELQVSIDEIRVTCQSS